MRHDLSLAGDFAEFGRPLGRNGNARAELLREAGDPRASSLAVCRNAGASAGEAFRPVDFDPDFGGGRCARC